MKKLLALLALFLMLSSCAKTQPDMPFTPSSRSFWYDETVYYTNDDNLLCYSKPKLGEMPLCLDPLCRHTDENCTARVIYYPSLAVTDGADGSPLVYFCDWKIADNETHDIRGALYRFDFSTGKRTALIDGELERFSSFVLFGQDIYLPTQSGDYGTAVWRIRTDGSGLTKLYEDPEHTVGIAAVGEKDGGRLLFWVDVEDGYILYVSPADFSEKTRLDENVMMFGNFISDGWFYYGRQSDETSPQLTGSAHPADKNHDKTADGEVILSQERTLYEYMRIPLDDPTVEPEFVAGGVQQPNMLSRPVFPANGKLYVIPYDPVYLETIAVTASGLTGDIIDDIDPDRERVEVDYIISKSGGKLFEIDPETGEQRVIETPGFDPTSILGAGDGMLALTGTVTDGERVRERLEAEGVNSSHYTFEETVLVPLG